MTDFKTIQRELARHIRDPGQHPFTQDIEDRRLAVYRELFFNNIKSFLDCGFPVLSSLYSEQQWHQLARDFFASHPSRSPYFSDIGLEFVEFLAGEYQPGAADPPFLCELAHYEWLELAISIRKARRQSVPWDGVSDYQAVTFSELASLVSYQFPVHQISLDFQPAEATEPVFIVVYRDEQDDVQFMLVNQVTAHLLDLIQQQESASVHELTQAMCQALPQFPVDQLRQAMSDILRQMLDKQILFPLAAV